MEIEKSEYEELVRDSERLRIIGILAESGLNFNLEVNQRAILLICGYIEEDVLCQ